MRRHIRSIDIRGRPCRQWAGVALLSLVSLCAWAGATGESPPKTRLDLGWGDLPPLPDAEGFAGAFAGTHQGALIVAGGANFPDGKPWEGGVKAWHDGIHVLRKTSDNSYGWLDQAGPLPRALAYGVSISTDQGVVCIGGRDADQSYADVYLLTWDPDAEVVQVRTLQPLPAPLSNMGGARLGNMIYLVGGDRVGVPSQTFWRLPLGGELADANWEQLDDFPGAARMMPTVAAQNDGMYNCLYVFSGRTSGALHTLQLFSDSWAYRPDTDSWIRKADVLGDRRDGTSGVPAAAAPSASIGAAHILVFGGGGSDRCSVGQRITNAVTIHAPGDQIIPGRRADHFKINTLVHARDQSFGTIDIGSSQWIGFPINGGAKQMRYYGHQRRIALVAGSVKWNFVDVFNQQVKRPVGQVSLNDQWQGEIGHGPVSKTMNPDSVDAVVPQRSFVTAANQMHLVAGLHRAFENVVQMQLRATTERVVDIPPVDRKDLQDQASGLEATATLRAITPMVGVV